MSQVECVVVTAEGPYFMKDGVRVGTKKGEVVRVSEGQAKAFAHQLKPKAVYEAEQQAAKATAQAQAQTQAKAKVQTKPEPQASEQPQKA